MSVWQQFTNDLDISIRTNRELIYDETSSIIDTSNTPFFTDGYFNGLLYIKGETATTFLHDLLTVDIKNIEDQCLLSAFCDPKGLIISNVWVFKDNDDYLLQLPIELIPLVLEHLKKYQLLYKVTITDVSDAYLSLGIYADDISKFLPSSEFKSLSKNQTVTMDKCLYLVKATLPLSIEVISSNTQSFMKIWSGLNNSSLTLTSNKMAKLFYLQQKLTQITLDTSKKHTPNHLNYEDFDGISYTKGCYIGQEIIARIKNLTTLKTNLYAITLDTTDLELKDGMSLVNIAGKTIAQLLNLVQLNDNTCAALVISKDSDVASNISLKS